MFSRNKNLGGSATATLILTFIKMISTDFTKFEISFNMSCEGKIRELFFVYQLRTVWLDQYGTGCSNQCCGSRAGSKC